MKSAKVDYESMTTAQLRKATAVFNRDLALAPDGLPGRAMTANERSRWQKVRRKLGRPKVGKGARKVMISLESDLLKRTDAFAREQGLSRSQAISAGLRKLMAG